MVIVEHAYVARDGKAVARQLSAATNEMVPGLARLADVIHANGVRTACQINHAGTSTTRAVTGTELLGPSPRSSGDPVRAMGASLIWSALSGSSPRLPSGSSGPGSTPSKSMRHTAICSTRSSRRSLTCGSTSTAAAVALERESVDLIDLTRPTPSARPSDPRFARSW